MDWDLYLALSGRGARFEKIEYPVGAFRRHDERVTASPAGTFYDEYMRLFEKHEIDVSHRRWGKWLHRGMKVMAGSYWKEAKARKVRGRGLRWFDDPRDRESFEELFRLCYGSLSSKRRIGA